MVCNSKGFRNSLIHSTNSCLVVQYLKWMAYMTTVHCLVAIITTFTHGILTKVNKSPPQTLCTNTRN